MAEHTIETLRADCWERNQRAKKLGWTRWYLIRETPGGGFNSETVTGAEAEECWQMLDDKPLVPVGWTEGNVAQAHGLTRWRLQHGMPADAFMLWAIPAREERRRAWIAQELRNAPPADHGMFDAA